MDDKQLQHERRDYLLKLMTSCFGGEKPLQSYADNRVFIIFGFTGSGKDTVIDGFLKNNKKYPFFKFVRTLTRPKRPSEAEVLSGYFIEKELFEHLKERERFFYHYEKFDGDEFGYDTVHFIFLVANGNLIMIGGSEKNADGLIKGMHSVFSDLPITTVFINRPKQTIIEGIKARGGDPEQIKKRIKAIEDNWYEKSKYPCDYSIWNEDMDKAIGEFQAMVEKVLGS